MIKRREGEKENKPGRKEGKEAEEEREKIMWTGRRG